ncbi:MAG: 30S ribosomal protein S17 [Berkelbacteria bacterium GW2011_GWB1_38_5]|uniref:30S ribosomal protein S17 n=2 Tax=Candidatus Berkelbacteria TaxID=1618330 RepID=A0A0G0LGF1_9BACT|nr:MAG: 30S ribosomal protein S17 [Berkelbacteria bacterium GW2011_GWB1_38_5]KKQ90968.1 MAG: 30S ribosomal protein S17 [Berkelbacteria bacterium GW2011_GWA1_39_10]
MSKITKLIGVALRDSLDKSVLINIDYKKIHPMYRKSYIKSQKFLVDTQKDVKKGQIVTIVSTRPISKCKSWKVINIKEAI